jgi:hypothetical protein
MPNYALYAKFDRSISLEISKIIDAVKDKFPDVESPSETPHLTILYGPALNHGEKEVTEYNHSDIERIYPTIHNYDINKVKLAYRGVSHFTRDTKYIIKLEFHSYQLDNLHTNLRRQLPEVNDVYCAAHMTDGDKSRQLRPERWLHAHIATITDKNILPDLEEYVRDLANGFPTELYLDNFTVMSAINDLPIRIPNIIKEVEIKEANKHTTKSDANDLKPLPNKWKDNTKKEKPIHIDPKYKDLYESFMNKLNDVYGPSSPYTHVNGNY